MDCSPTGKTSVKLDPSGPSGSRRRQGRHSSKQLYSRHFSLSFRGYPTFVLMVAMLLLPSPACSSMLVSTLVEPAEPAEPSEPAEPAEPANNLSSSSSFTVTCVKAFTSIGQELHYVHEFSSFKESAPVTIIDPSDNAACPHCCSFLSASSSGSSLPLSPTITSLVSNRTVLLTYDSLLNCKRPRVNALLGLESMHAQLDRSGAKAVIMITQAKEPFFSSNVVGTFTSTKDKREAGASLVPFVAVGSESGDRLIEQVQRNPNGVHVEFTYDVNPYLKYYNNYFEFPLKLASLLTFALMVHRCLNLGVRRSSSSGLPILTSTKNLIIFMALPTAASITIMVSFNGIAYLDEGSQGWALLSAGQMFPFLNLSSSVLVSRFWSSQKAHLIPNGGTVIPNGGIDGGIAGIAGIASDPAKSQPQKTFLIVLTGLGLDVVNTSLQLFSEGNLASVRQVTFLPLAAGYILTSANFVRSGLQVLRSQSADSKPLKTMAFYLLMVMVFTLIIVASYVMVSKELQQRVAEGGSVFQHERRFSKECLRRNEATLFTKLCNRSHLNPNTQSPSSPTSRLSLLNTL